MSKCERCGFGDENFPIAGGDFEGSGYCLVCFEWRREKEAQAAPFVAEYGGTSGRGGGGDASEDGQLELGEF